MSIHASTIIGEKQLRTTSEEQLRIKRAKLEAWEVANKPPTRIKPSLQYQVDAYLANGGKITVLPSTARNKQETYK